MLDPGGGRLHHLRREPADEREHRVGDETLREVRKGSLCVPAQVQGYTGNL